MKIGVFFCNCGTNISEKIPSEEIKEKLAELFPDVYFATMDFLCSVAGKEALKKDLIDNKIDRVVISACSPREHENTFMRVVSDAGINPYLMQMVNTREQVAWVTADRSQAREKTVRYMRAAIKRAERQAPLTKREIDVCLDVLVIGAGPAGLKAALTIAESGRRVVLVEQSPAIGGIPVRFEEISPNGECGSCMLEPLLGEILHGRHAENIELLTMAEVAEVVGSYGNFFVRISQKPRHINPTCIGCGECVEACPVSVKNSFNCNRDQRKAISFPYTGALPNLPFLDEKACLRLKGDACNKCREACPVDEAINFDEKPNTLERAVGAIVVAVGAGLYDCSTMPNLHYGNLPDIYTSYELEMIMSQNGPTHGEIVTSQGSAPQSIAIIHCVGSLDRSHQEYCSGICCQYGFKFNHIIEKKLPGTKITHFYKEISLPGKDTISLYQQAQSNPNSVFIRYLNIQDLSVSDAGGQKEVSYKNTEGHSGIASVDMVVLCPAVVPREKSKNLGALLDAKLDRYGFFEELHGRMDSAQSKMKGIFLAGTCQSPMDIQQAMNQGMATAGYILSGLAAGRKLEIQPITAVVDSETCSGCRLCVSVCPYKALSFNVEKEVAVVNDVLCQGCGTCVAACPAGSIRGNHFTNEEILAEIDEVLQ